MEEKELLLSTKEELNIYMSPVRQQILRALALAGTPQTPKALSKRLGISPSSVQHHLKLLLRLGVVKIDHTELINGITATFYAHTNATISIGLGGSSLQNEREATMLQLIQNVIRGFFDAKHRRGDLASREEAARYGNVMTGVIHLTPTQRDELLRGLLAFLRAHDAPGPDTVPWEFALVAYDTKSGLEEGEP